MTPQQLTNSIDGLVISANGRLRKSLAAVEEQLYNRLVTILKDIETDANGLIKQTSANRKILRTVQAEFDFIVSEQTTYQSSIERYLRNVPKIDALNAAYFDTISTAFTPNKVFIKQLQTNAINTVNSNLLQDGFVANVKSPIAEILNMNVNTGGSFSGMLEQLRTFIRGNPELDGRLISYSRGILNDTLFQYSRAYQQATAADLGLKWYRYIGGLVKDSREFCTTRAGGYFHESEIRAWAALEWKGRNKYTTESSIFVVLGGYNCSHQVVPVHESVVPKEDLDRIN